MAQDTMKVVIEDTLKRRFKVACAEQDTTMSDVVSALVQGWLDGKLALSTEQQDNDPEGK
jgi:hypothetical protein